MQNLPQKVQVTFTFTKEVKPLEVIGPEDMLAYEGDDAAAIEAMTAETFRERVEEYLDENPEVVMEDESWVRVDQEVTFLE